MRRSHGHFQTDKEGRNTKKSQRRNGQYIHLGHFEGIFERGVVRNTWVWNTKKRFDQMIAPFVEIVGVEPTTPCLQSRCSSQLSYTPRIFKNFVVPSRLELLTPTLSV